MTSRLDPRNTVSLVAVWEERRRSDPRLASFTIIDSEVLTSDIAHCFAFYRFQQFFISSAFGKNKKDAAFSGFDFSQAHEVIVFVASHFLVEAND